MKFKLKEAEPQAEKKDGDRDRPRKRARALTAHLPCSWRPTVCGFVYLLIYSCGDERYPKRKIIFKINSFWDMMHDATKITENFSVAFSWRLSSQGCRLSIYGGFRHFWRTLVLICLEIQLNSTLHGFVLR